LFLAGVNRKIEDGACVGIHSWNDHELPQGMTPLDLPSDHEEHQIYLEYYEFIGIDPDFYWYTLEIADAQSMHWMQRDEFDDFRIDVTSLATDDVTLTRLPACDQR
ncbi:MAG: alpha/beta hydrolase, partial [Henriciella sp.]|nr:alpha/beta hydrolase [Henriciella sp.]